MRRDLWFFGVLAGLLLACGDDDGPAFSTGLAPDRQLSDLSDAERTMTCEALVDAYDMALGPELERFDCLLAALPDSVSVTLSGELHGDVEHCRQLQNQCVADGGVPAGSAVLTRLTQVNCSSAAATVAQRTCDATVAEYEQCNNAVIADLDTLVSSANCSDTIARIERTQQLNQAQPPRTQSSQCTALVQKCPAIDVPATQPAE